jgi:arylsulfatase A-like enzyme
VTSRKRSKPRHPLFYIIWGGFNAGAVIGLLDALLIMVFGLGTFSKMGSIMGVILIDALGFGCLGILSAVAGYGLTYRFKSRHPSFPRLFSGIVLLSISSVLILGNIGWSFKPVTSNSAENARNILLVTLDTVRADAVGFGGNSIVRTPILDSLARQGWQFCNAICPVPMTTPSHASLLTSAIPAVHGAMENRYRLGKENTSLAELLRKNGFRTAAFVSCFPLDRRFGLDQGFMLYNDELATPGDLRQASWLKRITEFAGRNKRERPARFTNSLVLPWIRKYANASPFFLWVHYFDPHAPYTPSNLEANYYMGSIANFQDYQTETHWEMARRAVVGRRDQLQPGIPESLYLGEISTVDNAVGEILDELKRYHVLTETDIIVVADHGESFGEHDRFYTHGEDIYEPALQIPMILAGRFFPDRTLENNLTSITDIAPTLLSGCGISIPSVMTGYNLLDQQSKRQSELIENYGIILAKNAEKQRGIRTSNWKCVLNGDYSSRRLYDVAGDPLEMEDVQSKYSQVAVELDHLVQDGFQRADQNRKPSDIDSSTETLNKLKALGYVF